MTTLLKTTLRMRPDRILVGEVRGAEALDLLDAWNTGHEGGAATLHANNAAAGLTRLKSLITRNESAPSEIEPLIGEAVHVVVHIARTPDGSRRIQEILEVSGYDDGHYINSCNPLRSYDQCKRLFPPPSALTSATMFYLGLAVAPGVPPAGSPARIRLRRHRRFAAV